MLGKGERGFYAKSTKRERGECITLKRLRDEG